MVMTLKVPSMVCEGCGERITKEINTHDPEAKVNVDLTGKIVTVESTLSEESIKEMIVAVGHTVE
ncbi:MAG: heavy-metal-associated domain-containing protein [Gomphosphaeria aponina SAG 52.96 = DSM 107014]|uniref:Heavy-metal-associated domain-containing protein n=1 Tax=Gomphosphaeria aponina SAG 52.96 = DSM 107014 TaxID=1521640 RepID=A0A941JSJ0_9CHRO|nr:heavy-metal-associated domain-containing protein [Gomphosphaeria aponina SAG 52.96 = DSM 107014]